MTAAATIQVVIPMAGLGTRFAEAGYPAAKPLLPIHGEPMFKVVMANLLTEQVATVTVIAQAAWRIRPMIEDLNENLAQEVRLIEIDYITSGPADTVELSRPYLNSDWPVVTANSDQYVDAMLDDFYDEVLEDGVAGCIIAMEDSDPKWSYAAVSADGTVAEVREKKVISPFATVGIYGFESAALMFDAFDEMRHLHDTVNGEFYVAPAYNRIIERGRQVTLTNLGPVSSVMHGMGIPEDYERFLLDPVSLRAAAQARLLAAT